MVEAPATGPARVQDAGRCWLGLLAGALALVALLGAACGGGSQGERLFRQNCSACHGDKGNRIPDIPLNDPGFLSRLGTSGLITVISEGKGIMPAWGKEREGPLDDDQIRTIAAYMLSPDGLSAVSGKGRSLFVKNCASCHGAKGTRIPAAPLNSTTFVSKLGDDGLRTTIEKGKGTMPAFGKDYDGPLSSAQVDELIRYVQTLSGASTRLATASFTAGSVKGEDPGQQTFASVCSGCHGAAGNAIASADLTSPDFLSSRSDAALAAAISNGTGAMPAQGKAAGGRLSDEDVQAVVAYLKRAAGVSNGGSAAAAAGVLKPPPAGAEDLFKKNCASCHAGLPVSDVDPTQIHTIIKDGLSDRGMPAFGSRLSDAEIEGLASLIASGQPISGAGGESAASAAANRNPFSGVVRHVDGWISKHPDVVREQGSQLCQKCHQVSFCSSCHTAR